MKEEQGFRFLVIGAISPVQIIFSGNWLYVHFLQYAAECSSFVDGFQNEYLLQDVV